MRHFGERWGTGDFFFYSYSTEKCMTHLVSIFSPQIFKRWMLISPIYHNLAWQEAKGFQACICAFWRRFWLSLRLCLIRTVLSEISVLIAKKIKAYHILSACTFTQQMWFATWQDPHRHIINVANSFQSTRNVTFKPLLLGVQWRRVILTRRTRGEYRICGQQEG